MGAPVAQAGQPQGGALYGQQQQLDPQTAALLQALQAKQQPQGGAMTAPPSAGLLAQALDQYAAGQRGQGGAAPPAVPAPPPVGQPLPPGVANALSGG